MLWGSNVMMGDAQGNVSTQSFLVRVALFSVFPWVCQTAFECEALGEKGGGARESFSFVPTTHSSGGKIIMLWRWGLLLSTAPKPASLDLNRFSWILKHRPYWPAVIFQNYNPAWHLPYMPDNPKSKDAVLSTAHIRVSVAQNILL